MEFFDLLKDTVNAKASDLHITVGIPPVMRIHGELQRCGETSMKPGDTDAFIRQILSETQLEELEDTQAFQNISHMPGNWICLFSCRVSPDFGSMSINSADGMHWQSV